MGGKDNCTGIQLDCDSRIQSEEVSETDKKKESQE